MKKVLGGKSETCDYCGGTMLIIKIGDGIFYQCIECGTLTKNYPHEKVKIYS